MISRLKVLVICSDPANRQTLKRVLEECHLATEMCSTVSDARARLARKRVPLVFCEAELADGSYRDVLGAPECAKANVPVVVTSRAGETHQYLEAMRLGAFDYMASPYRRSEVEWIVSHVAGTVGAAA